MNIEPRWLTDQEMRSWRAYVLTKPLLEHQLHRELQDEHGVSLVDYELMVYLSEREGLRMRMSELAYELGESKSKVSHQVDRMQRAGLVCRTTCGDDARGVYAQLTDAGMAKLRTAAPTHVRGVRSHVIALLDDTELAVLERVFGRISDHLRGLRE